MTNSAETATVHDETVRVRRSPKFGSFMAVGAGAGVLAGVALAVGQPVRGGDTLQQIIGFLALITGVIGAAAGALVALAFDRTFAKRAQTVAATRTEINSGDSAPSAETAPSVETASSAGADGP